MMTAEIKTKSSRNSLLNTKKSKTYAAKFEAALKNFDLFVEEEKEKNFLEVKKLFAGYI